MPARMLLALVLAAVMHGCGMPTEPVPSGARAVELADFTTSSNVPGSHVVELPEMVTAMPEVVTREEGTEIGDTEVTETESEIIASVPGIGEEGAEIGPVEIDEVVKTGERWPVDGLIGQINGRPVFAAEFFFPIEDRLVQLGRSGSPTESRDAIIRLVHERFSSYVNSELIIAEAESELTPQMQEGIFAWLGMVEEEITAERGGTRFAAEQSILDETGMTIEEFLEQQRKIGLAGQLLRKQVEPRTIVSWRDIEQAYMSNIALYRPPREVLIGRILLLASRDAEKIQQVTESFARGDGFKEVATSIGMEEGGSWRAFTLGSEGIEGINGLRQNVRDALAGLSVDEASKALEGTSSTAWYAILGYETPPSRSIFDGPVQLGIRAGLEKTRYDMEEQRYLRSLRRRWVNDDIKNMELRLFEIALRRYWQP